MDVRAMIASFFIMLKEDTYVLIRIEILVALVTVMFLVMFMMDIYRCRSRCSFVITVLKTVDGLSDQIVVYLIGAMQSATFENHLFPVWAVVLVSLRSSLGYLSGYGIPDRERRLTELANVTKFIAVGVLNGTRALEFTKPLWSLWAILLLRSMYRFFAGHMAIISLWHGRSSEFLPEYMRTLSGDCEQSNISAGHRVQSNVSAGYRERSNISASHCEQSNNPLWSLWAIPRNMYRFFAGHMAIISLWHGRSSEFHPECMRTSANQREQSNDLHKDQKYLIYGESNQRITLKRPGYTLELEVIDKKSLITLGKISECSEPLLCSNNSHRYKDMSLAFTLSRLLRCRLEDVTLHRESILMTQHLITSETTGMLGMDAERVFRILELELAFVRDYFYTLYPVVFWQGLGSLCFSLLQSMLTFAIIFWLAVGICKVYKPPGDTLVLWVNGCNVDVVITWVFMSFMMFKEIWEMVTYLLSNWTRLLLVCKYVQSRLWFVRNALTVDLISSFFTSKIADPWHQRIDQYDFLQSYTYKACFWKLANALTLGKIPKKPDGQKRGEAIKIPEGVKPAVLQALCRIGVTGPQLRKYIPSLNSPDQFARYKWACLELRTCSQVILVWHIATSLCEIKLAQDHDIDLTNPGFLHSAWTYLKNKCLCTSQPYLVDENILQDGELKNNYRIANSLSRYCAYLQVFQPALLPDSFVVPAVIFEKTLKDTRGRLDDCNLIECRYSKLMEAAEDSVDSRLSMSIMRQGATLAKDLINYEKEESSRWRILAGVWADLLVHIAPSWNAAQHKNNLEAGGEFITLIWALLWHCGIEKSSLWDKDEVSGSNSQRSETSNSGSEREGANAQTDTANQTQRQSKSTNGSRSSSTN